MEVDAETRRARRAAGRRPTLLRRGRALALALLACARPSVGLAAPPEALTGPIVLQERTPLALLVSTPTGETANTSSSDLIRMISARLEARTSYFLQVIDAQVATDCRGRLGCVVEQLRAPYPTYLLVVAQISLAGQADRLSAVLVEVETARALAEGAEGEDDGDGLRGVEARITERAVRLGPERAQVNGPGETDAFVERLFAERLARVFRDGGTWDPYGSIALSGVPAGVAIHLDGAPVGAARAGVTELREVTAGARRITLEGPGFEPWTDTVEVVRGERAQLAPTLVRSGVRLVAGARAALKWTGTAAALGGAALTAYSLARHDATLTPVCLAVPGTRCRDAASFETLAYTPDAPLGDAVNPPGVRAAPLGAALLGVGATWALGTWLLGAEEDLPWPQLLAGLALGAAIYGLSSGLDGNSP